MSNLTKTQANRIIRDAEFGAIKSYINNNSLSIRCSKGTVYFPELGGDGYNISTYNYNDSIKYATAVYASVCFAQDTISDGIDNYYLLLMENCSLSSSKTYKYSQGEKCYLTLPKCQGLGVDAKVKYYWPMNDSSIDLSRRLIELLLTLSSK